MKHSILLAASLVAAGALGCSSDDDNETATGNLLPDVEGALGKANRPETLGENRIDRAGRPAISAALIATFAPADRDAELDLYNRSGNGNRRFIPIIETSLAVLDGLDGVCGNQLRADEDPVEIYRPLATTLNDDQIYVQSDREGAGRAYLGVEAEVLGKVAAGSSSGGRVPNEDVVARSYSLLAAGAFRGIDDGVPTDDAVHSIDVFPFLAASQLQ